MSFSGPVGGPASRGGQLLPDGAVQRARPPVAAALQPLGAASAAVRPAAVAAQHPAAGGRDHPADVAGSGAPARRRGGRAGPQRPARPPRPRPPRARRWAASASPRSWPTAATAPRPDAGARAGSRGTQDSATWLTEPGRTARQWRPGRLLGRRPQLRLRRAVRRRQPGHPRPARLRGRRSRAECARRPAAEAGDQGGDLPPVHRDQAHRIR